jgi:hypothetical protein
MAIKIHQEAKIIGRVKTIRNTKMI